MLVARISLHHGLEHTAAGGAASHGRAHGVVATIRDDFATCGNHELSIDVIHDGVEGHAVVGVDTRVSDIDLESHLSPGLVDGRRNGRLLHIELSGGNVDVDLKGRVAATLGGCARISIER